MTPIHPTLPINMESTLCSVITKVIMNYYTILVNRCAQMHWQKISVIHCVILINHMRQTLWLCEVRLKIRVYSQHAHIPSQTRKILMFASKSQKGFSLLLKFKVSKKGWNNERRHELMRTVLSADALISYPAWAVPPLGNWWSDVHSLCWLLLSILLHDL